MTTSIFHTSMDLFARTVTYILLVITGSLVLLTIASIIGIDIFWVELPIPLTCILSVLIISIYVYKPLLYEVGISEVVIKRFVGDLTFQFKDIQEIKLLGREQLSWTLRTFGNGGLFGYTGKYWNRKLGSMDWYATQRHQGILLILKNNKKVFVTPDQPQHMFNQINERIKTSMY